MLHFNFATIKSRDRLCYMCCLGKALRSEGKHRIVVERFMDKSSESLVDNLMGIGVAPDKKFHVKHYAQEMTVVELLILK